MKYGCLAVKGKDDLQILFHCPRQFPKPVNVAGASSTKNQRELDVPQIVSSSFDFNLQDFNLQAEAATGGNELGDSRSFGELGVAMAATP
ncbi:hypothetical protein PIB30_048187 [Stylosanthes scabra]|uniref:Uncharacterized protein n=1 Tax=Stylosanthes scabra TaxID=79078 RepID=A0ABU6ZFP6_9FABA|nr:hypothetical protein [Stylosanthes scabra]